ncbi:alpha/beta-hydrolase [Clavulina sp. PMI_390]|nr:alpha/beta-hydrolase [Clavulina sp. PMI_390]
MPDCVQCDIPARFDGFLLKAQRFDPPQNTPHKAAAVLCNATGIPAWFYQDFASWLAQQGVSVITFDYRYTGLSWPPELAPLASHGSTLESRLTALRQVPEDVNITHHWAARDAAAVVRYAAERWKDLPLVAIGHSIGAIVLALLSEERHLITRFLNISAANYFVGNHDDPIALVKMLRDVFPLLETERVWYSSRIGAGADLSYGVGKELVEWFLAPRHALRTDVARSAIRSLNKPYLAIGFSDDSIVTLRMMSRFLSQFSHSDGQKAFLWIDPNSQQPPWPSCGHHESFTRSELSESVDSDNDPSSLTHQNTIWPIYLNWIAEGEVNQSVGEYRVLGLEDEFDPLENESRSKNMGSRLSRTEACEFAIFRHPIIPKVANHRTTILSGIIITRAAPSDLLAPHTREFTLDSFITWILSDAERSSTAIRRVDLIKSTQARHAFHEALLLHVYGDLRDGAEKFDDIYGGRVCSGWWIVLERAGTLPQQTKKDISDIPINEATKLSRLQAVGSAADRVLLAPCSIAPFSPSALLPYMRHRAVIKTLQIPHRYFYRDRAQFARDAAFHDGRPPPPHDFDFETPVSMSWLPGSSHSMGPTFKPLCISIQDLPKETGGYRILATNCYFFSRVVFGALHIAYSGQWEVLDGSGAGDLATSASTPHPNATNEAHELAPRPVPSAGPPLDDDPIVPGPINPHVSPEFSSQPAQIPLPAWAPTLNSDWRAVPASVFRLSRWERKQLTPMQRTALWLNERISKSSDMGELMRKTAARMADGMTATYHFTELEGFFDLTDEAEQEIEVERAGPSPIVR